MYLDKLDDWVAEQYRRRGYFITKDQGYLMLRFAENASRPHAIIKCVERDMPMTATDVFSLFTDFEYLHTGDSPCFQYRIICPAGFEPECKEFLNYNVSLSDASYLKEITNPNYVYLFAHNELMCEKIREGFKQSQRVAAIQATGSGKSLLIAEMVKELKGKKQLIVVPRRNIINEIGRQLPKGFRGVMFETYQHLCQMEKPLLKSIQADRIYLDEFHHMGAEKWGLAVKTILDNNPQAQVLGTTATTCHISSKEGKRDMSKSWFDRTAGEMPLEEALVRHVLTTPHYVCMPSSYADVKEKLLARPGVAKSPEKSQKIIDMVDEMAAKQPIHELLSKHMPDKTGRMLVFCPTVDELKRNKRLVKDLLVKAGFTPVVYQYYHSANDQRTTKGLDEMLSHTTTKRLQVLFCVDMLNEGVHIPDVTAAIFMRRTDSDTLFKQQLGRLMDAASTHKTVVFDMVDNIFNRNIQDIQLGVEQAMLRKTEQMRAYLGFYKERHPVQFDIVDYNEAIRQQERQIAGPERTVKRLGLGERLDAIEANYGKRQGLLHIPANDPAARQDYEFMYNLLNRFKNNQLSDLDRQAIVARSGWINFEMEPRFTRQLYDMVADFKRNPAQNIQETHKLCFKELSTRLIQAKFTPRDYQILTNSPFMMSWSMKLKREARIIYRGLQRGELAFQQDPTQYLLRKEMEALAKQQGLSRKQASTKTGKERKGDEQARPFKAELGKSGLVNGSEQTRSRKHGLRI